MARCRHRSPIVKSRRNGRKLREERTGAWSAEDEGNEWPTDRIVRAGQAQGLIELPSLGSEIFSRPRSNGKVDDEGHFYRVRISGVSSFHSKTCRGDVRGKTSARLD